MKALSIIFFAFFTLGLSTPLSAQTSTQETKKDTLQNTPVEVFYFHYTRRCATCNAVEEVSKNALSDMYGEKVAFTSYNLDDKAGKTKGKKLKVSGQTLLIVSGNKQVNLTNDAFIHARNHPEKLKALLKENIDALL